MKEKVHENIYVGSDEACFTEEREGWAVVHACKNPCHQRVIGYKGSLLKDHPNYLKFEQDSHLYLNLIDPDDRPLFYPISFHEALRFIEEQISDKKVLIHCNEGRSRSPSIALLYLASEGIIENSSYASARRKFQNEYYSNYRPAGGIQTFLSSNWGELI